MSSVDAVVEAIKDELGKAGTADNPSLAKVVEQLSGGRAIVARTFVTGPDGCIIARGDGCVAVRLSRSTAGFDVVKRLQSDGLACVWPEPTVVWVLPVGTPREIRERFRTAKFPQIPRGFPPGLPG